MSDLIDRQAVIDALHMHLMYRMGTDSNKKRLDDWINGVPSAQPEPIKVSVDREMTEEELKELKKKIADSPVVLLPSAQPEIVRCGQCKYAEVADKEDAQDGYTCQFHRGSIWFSGSYCSWAERRTDGRD